MIRILLIDDHTLFRSGVKALLQRQPDFEVVGEASDGLEGVKMCIRDSMPMWWRFIRWALSW